MEKCKLRLSHLIILVISRKAPSERFTSEGKTHITPRLNQAMLDVQSKGDRILHYYPLANRQTGFFRRGSGWWQDLFCSLGQSKKVNVLRCAC